MSAGGAGLSSADNFKIYKEAIDVLEESGVRYVIGGGIAIMAFGRTRDTKDIDLYIMDSDQDRALQALARAGFEVDPMPGVHWLCKGYKKGITVDFIIENVGGMHTTKETLDHGRWTCINGYRMHVMSPEDLIVRKIMAMRSDRNDWFDCISVLSSTYERFDWEYFNKVAAVDYERALSFVLYVRSDREHVVPVPDRAVAELYDKVGPELKMHEQMPGARSRHEQKARPSVAGRADARARTGDQTTHRRR
ncbi:MAG: nucleotidyltransferase [Methanocella sp.]